MLYLQASIVLNQLYPESFWIFNQTGNTEAKKSFGRPKITNNKMDRLICRKSRANRFRSAKQISQMLPSHNISVRTIQSSLRENQLVAHVAQKNTRCRYG